MLTNHSAALELEIPCERNASFLPATFARRIIGSLVSSRHNSHNKQPPPQKQQHAATKESSNNDTNNTPQQHQQCFCSGAFSPTRSRWQLEKRLKTQKKKNWKARKVRDELFLCVPRDRPHRQQCSAVRSRAAVLCSLCRSRSWHSHILFGENLEASFIDDRVLRPFGSSFLTVSSKTTDYYYTYCCGVRIGARTCYLLVKFMRAQQAKI